MQYIGLVQVDGYLAVRRISQHTFEKVTSRLLEVGVNATSERRLEGTRVFIA